MADPALMHPRLLFTADPACIHLQYLFTCMVDSGLTLPQPLSKTDPTLTRSHLNFLSDPAYTPSLLFMTIQLSH